MNDVTHSISPRADGLAAALDREAAPVRKAEPKPSDGSFERALRAAADRRERASDDEGHAASRGARPASPRARGERPARLDARGAHDEQPVREEGREVEARPVDGHDDDDETIDDGLEEHDAAPVVAAPSLWFGAPSPVAPASLALAPDEGAPAASSTPSAALPSLTPAVTSTSADTTPTARQAVATALVDDTRAPVAPFAAQLTEAASEVIDDVTAQTPIAPPASALAAPETRSTEGATSLGQERASKPASPKEATSPRAITSAPPKDAATPARAAPVAEHTREPAAPATHAASAAQGRQRGPSAQPGGARSSRDEETRGSPAAPPAEGAPATPGHALAEAGQATREPANREDAASVAGARPTGSALAHAGAPQPTDVAPAEPKSAEPSAQPTSAVSRQEAASSAANHMTLRREAHLDVDVPGLGRVRVGAANKAGSVDVHVVAELASTAQMLETHRVELRHELREATIPLGQLSIGGGETGGARGGEAGTGGAPRSPMGEARGGDATNASTRAEPTVGPRRVRIVL